MSDLTMTEPVQPEPQRTRRTGLVVGAVVVLVVALAGGGAVAAWRFFGPGGPQPADVLPADTLAVMSVDLDPSGGQKIEAIRALRSFPTFREKVGLEEGDDPLRVLFEKLQDEEDVCPGVDYAEDVQPWVGKRFAVAAVPGGKGAEPQPVALVQVEDADAARAGLEKLQACAQDESGSDETGGLVVGDDFLVLAETEKTAQRVLDDASEDSLGDDADYRKWTEEAGGAGIVSVYAAPGAGEALTALGGEDALVPPEAADLEKQLADFEGGALTLRFDGGGLVLAGAFGSGQSAPTGGSVAEQVGSLPDDTAAVLAIGSSEKSREQIRKRLDEVEPGPVDDLLGQVEGGLASVGLEFPDDLLTVLGDTISISVGGDAPESLDAISSPGDVPAGIRVDGDADAVKDVISRAEEGIGESLDAQGVVVDSDDDTVALSLQKDYAEQLLGDGGLGEDEVFGEVVPELDRAQALLFLRFDSDWRDLLLDTLPDEASRGDLEAVQALGLSVWNQDSATHVEVRVALD